MHDMTAWCAGAVPMPWGQQPMQQPNAGFYPGIPPPTRQTQHEAYANLHTPARPASPAQPEAQPPSLSMLTLHLAPFGPTPDALQADNLLQLSHTSSRLSRSSDSCCAVQH